MHLKKDLFYVYECLSAWMYYSTYILVPMEAKEDVRSLGAGDACDCGLLCGCLE